MPPKLILVTGATGKQGGALIDALLSHPGQSFEIYALTRNASSPSANRLTSKGVQVIEGNTTVPTAIFAHLPPLHGVFLVTVPDSNEEAQALSFIDAAISHGVQHFVFTSVDRGGPVRSETDRTPIPHFGTKLDIERYLKNASAKNGGSMKWTILRPTSFMDNLAPGFVGRALAVMIKQMGSVKLSLIAVRDIGRVAARVFVGGDEFAGRALTLTGDLLDFDEMNEVFREEMGTDLPLGYGFVADGLQWAIGDLGKTMKFFREGGYGYEMDRGLAEELELKDFRTWLREISKFNAVSG